MSATFPTVTAPAPGTLLGWGVAAGQLVEAGARLGEVMSAAGERLAILAPCRGTFSQPTPRQSPVAEGQPLARIIPTAGSDALQQPPARATAAPTAPRHAPIVEELKLEPAAPLAPQRAELATVAPSPLAERVPAPLGQGEKLRTKNRTYSIGTHHERAIKRLAHELALDDSAPNAGESELVRAALSMLLDLPRPALVALVEKNKARERAGSYGVGRPRPGRERRR